MADRREKELFLFCCSLPLSAVIAGDSWHFFHWEKSAKKQGEVIMLTKPKHSHEQCMSLSHSQVWRGFKVEDGIICKMGKNTRWIRCVVCVCFSFCSKVKSLITKQPFVSIQLHRWIINLMPQLALKWIIAAHWIFFCSLKEGYYVFPCFPWYMVTLGTPC